MAVVITKLLASKLFLVSNMLKYFFMMNVPQEVNLHILPLHLTNRMTYFSGAGAWRAHGSRASNWCYCELFWSYMAPPYRPASWCNVLIALSRCNRVFTRRLRLCHSHTVYRRVVRKGGREGPNRVESEV